MTASHAKPSLAAPDPAPALSAWLSARGWTPFAFQQTAWLAITEGRSGLLHASTGAGKTYAVWLGLLLRCLAQPELSAPPSSAAVSVPSRRAAAPPLSVLWITPMRALASDTLRALQSPLTTLAPHWTLGMRTGDTTSAERARQDRRWPTTLLTTPESLSLMLSRSHALQELGQVQAVVVDEWHELLGTKRGVQVQLALARLKRLNPKLIVWGMSATLGNLDEALHALLGQGDRLLAPVVVQGKVDKALVIDTLVPDNPGKYSWAGHLGARMQQPVIDEIEGSPGTTLVFTNTRSQAEIWYQLMLAARPEWAGTIAIHHSSLDKATRDWVEGQLKEGALRAVVATSSLDLGVDFLPVERVLQIGSAKGVARLLQRAGRSGHAPGRTSRVTLVPTNTLELLEAAAARRAAYAGQVEKRAPPERPLDVLVQHLVTVALGGGFVPGALFDEVRSAWSYRDLTQEAFDWALAFCERGGTSLTAYPDYHRIALDADGIYRVPQARVARLHRLSIGTIVGDGTLQVKFLRGSKIGTVEESFVARLRKGDCFVFAGRLLEFIRIEDMTAYVKKAEKSKGAVATWNGGKMPLSTEMADAVLALMKEASEEKFLEPEMRAAEPMLRTQMRLSSLPTPDTLLVETFASREGFHLFVYPFAGRAVHLGLANLLAWRLARRAPNTFSLSINDYGLELLSAQPFDLDAVLGKSVFGSDDLLVDVLDSLNASELSRRRFREIARVAGLVFTGYPGALKSMKQLQASSGLFFDVFRKYDSGNLLLTQADQEVLSQELDIVRLRATLALIAGRRVVHMALTHPSPLCLPMMVERFREKMSTEQLSARLDRILQDMEQDINSAKPTPKPLPKRKPRTAAKP